METVYDWLTVMIFAGLVVLFMQRSTADNPGDSLWQYLAASIGCAAANWLGNHAIKTGEWSFHVVAVAVLLGTLAFIAVVLRPVRWR